MKNVRKANSAYTPLRSEALRDVWGEIAAHFLSANVRLILLQRIIVTPVYLQPQKKITNTRDSGYSVCLYTKMADRHEKRKTHTHTHMYTFVTHISMLQVESNVYRKFRSGSTSTLFTEMWFMIPPFLSFFLWLKTKLCRTFFFLHQQQARVHHTH